MMEQEREGVNIRAERVLSLHSRPAFGLSVKFEGAWTMHSLVRKKRGVLLERDREWACGSRRGGQ